MSRFAIRNYAGCYTEPFTTVSGQSNGKITASNADMAPGAGSFWFALTIQQGLPSIAGTSKFLLELGTDYTTNGWAFGIIGNGLSVYESAGVARVSTSAGVISDHAWVRLFVTFNASDTKIRVYANGATMVTSAAIGVWNITATQINIGHSATLGAGFSMAGQYQDVQLGVGATVPSLTDVQNDYFLGTVAPSAIHRWKLDQTSGTNAPDSIGSANGTLANSGVFTASNAWLRNRVAVP